MIRILFLILFFLTLQSAVAEETPSQKSSVKGDTSPPVEKPEDTTEQKPATWPRPFTPSQSVGADSQVAFPTDI